MRKKCYNAAAKCQNVANCAWQMRARPAQNRPGLPGLARALVPHLAFVGPQVTRTCRRVYKVSTIPEEETSEGTNNNEAVETKAMTTD
ncbi:unnamed protein product [Phyllotreta striolata]|uniref:Uncharacterized protein n=1 Tax=Phyllotreta striolata TaxID=444603 RepID=A0A9N9TMS9_PHYSR|nr:unnamed protein product [Phyllotreta striolata]